MHIDFLRERFAAAADREALIWRDRVYTYAWLLEELNRLGTQLETLGVSRGAVVGIEADFSPRAVALLLARRCDLMHRAREPLGSEGEIVEPLRHVHHEMVRLLDGRLDGGRHDVADYPSQ